MKLTPKETTQIMEAMSIEVYNLFLNTLNEYADGTKEKRQDITTFLGDYLTEAVAANVEYFAKFK